MAASWTVTVNCTGLKKQLSSNLIADIASELGTDVKAGFDMVAAVNGVGLVINAVKDGQRGKVGYCLIDAKDAPAGSVDAIKAIAGVRTVDVK